MYFVELMSWSEVLEGLFQLDCCMLGKDFTLAVVSQLAWPCLPPQHMVYPSIFAIITQGHCTGSGAEG